MFLLIEALKYNLGLKSKEVCNILGTGKVLICVFYRFEYNRLRILTGVLHVSMKARICTWTLTTKT